MSMVRRGCSVATTFTVEELSYLASLPVGANELEGFAWCELEPGHGGEWHYALGQSANDGHWWLRWKPTGRELLVRESCTAKGDPLPVPPTRRLPFPDAPHLDVEDPVVPKERPCLLFAEHPGAHSFAFGLPDDDQVRRPALSVGQVRRAWQALADDTPIRIAAAGTGVLTENAAEVLVQATGEAWLQSSLSAGVRGAAVLLAGHGALPPQGTAPDGEPEPDDATVSTGGKVKVPAYITNEALDRLRNTVVALQSGDRTVTLTSFVQAAIAAAVKQAEEKHNDGRPFPARRKELKTGPPID
ncbi:MULTISPECIES: hypothetical protein [unclassified Streptomyces]|uniref:hypothetical protein n=1 Tax=unclassified Streptomyces TaxID=2593676 RepID=UPI003802118C